MSPQNTSSSSPIHLRSRCTFAGLGVVGGIRTHDEALITLARGWSSCPRQPSLHILQGDEIGRLIRRPDDDDDDDGWKVGVVTMF